MSAEVMREAATILRDHASKATPDSWKVWGMSVLADTGHDSDVDKATLVAHTRHEAGLRTFNADYIALVDPRVGLALADMLDEAANCYLVERGYASDHLVTIANLIILGNAS